MVDKDVVKELTSELSMSPGLARDLLTLAGGDKQAVIEASENASHLDGVKAAIIDARFSKLEK